MKNCHLQCIRDLVWSLVKVARWLYLCYFWLFSMEATFIGPNHSLPKIGSSLKLNHQNQFKLVQIPVTHCRLNACELEWCYCINSSCYYLCIVLFCLCPLLYFFVCLVKEPIKETLSSYNGHRFILHYVQMLNKWVSWTESQCETAPLIYERIGFN